MRNILLFSARYLLPGGVPHSGNWPDRLYRIGMTDRTARSVRRPGFQGRAVPRILDGPDDGGGIGGALHAHGIGEQGDRAGSDPRHGRNGFLDPGAARRAGHARNIVLFHTLQKTICFAFLVQPDGLGNFRGGNPRRDGVRRGIFGCIFGKGVGVGRADLQSDVGAISAGSCRVRF